MKNKKLFAILTLVCFMFTLMPVAAFAQVDAETSAFEAVDGDQTVRLQGAATTETIEGITYAVAVGETKPVEFEFDMNTANETVAATTGTVYIWAENAAGEASSALKLYVDDVQQTVGAIANVYEVAVTDLNAATVIAAQFVRTGEFTVKAGLNLNVATKVSELTEFTADDFSVITVKGANVNPSTYEAVVAGSDLSYTATGTTTTVAASDVVTPGTFTVGTAKVELAVTPNNVMTDELTVTFTDGSKPLKKEAVTVETNSAAIEVKADAKTNNQGELDFTVSASVEGTYEIDFTVAGETWTLLVQVGYTGATYIETENEPAAPQALYGALGQKVRFTITDINGNIVKTDDKGMDGISSTNAKTKAKYVVLTEKPADSDLESEELGLTYGGTNDTWYLTGVTNMDAEGTYSVKVILDNGAYATASWTVKAFDKPVVLKIKDIGSTLELGTSDDATLVYVDANGVEKNADDAVLAATGYAVSSLAENTTTTTVNNDWTLTVKDDEKYVGSVITLTAVSDKYDLVSAAKEIKVSGEAVAIAFEDANLEVDVNNTVKWNVVDEDGNKVTLSSNVTVGDIKYIVVDKPEGAKVSVTDKTGANFDGDGKMALTSNMVGNVTVQVIVQVELTGTAGQGTQYKYYTGVEVFPVGTDSTGDVVVMSIGSDQIVVNDEIKEIPAPAVIKDSRTFVPFRALAEAFGAEVAWDAATQSVTAELNGVTIVLTIGSPVYTVNGVEKAADVAPYIAGDGYTMVPARAIAEEFGMKVLFTTDANGAVADVLYLM